jgi:hypothetical protein
MPEYEAGGREQVVTRQRKSLIDESETHSLESIEIDTQPAGLCVLLVRPRTRTGTLGQLADLIGLLAVDPGSSQQLASRNKVPGGR